MGDNPLVLISNFNRGCKFTNQIKIFPCPLAQLFLSVEVLVFKAQPRGNEFCNLGGGLL